MSGPLQGLRVVDATTILLGPLATQILGDMGADVIKVEAPEGDATRDVGPPPAAGMGAVFLACNRNKRSLVLDLKRAPAREAFLRLCESADVVVHNMRPRAAARLGIDHDAVAARNPRIVYCATHGFRAAGPYGDKPAYDDMIQAASGLAALQGAGGEPRYVTSAIADKITALTVVYAVSMALLHRERAGVGQRVEVPMYETLVAFNMVEHLYGRAYAPARGGAGYPRTLSAHRRPHRTVDGHVGVMPYSDRQWQALFEVADRPDLAADPRFATMAARLANVDVLYAELAAMLATRTTAAWLDALDAANVPAMAVASPDALLDDPHLAATGFWSDLDGGALGTLRLPGIAVAMSASPGAIRRRPPTLGEHSAEVLAEIGYSEAEIAELAASGATRGAEGTPGAGGAVGG
ncbi:MAG: CoA transferase [Ectothiorhodospiraceae bacterium]|nr:CoA transferase [Ectothiorhodospiraceae bacterium]